MKLCRPCGKVKPIEDFLAKSSGKYFYPCFDCRRKKGKVRRDKARAASLCASCLSRPQLPFRVICQECLTTKKAYDKRQSVYLKENNICVYCQKAPRWKNHNKCEMCHIKSKQEDKGVRSRRVAKGLCSRCGKEPISPTSKDRCETCLGYCRAYNRLQRQEVFERYGNVCACCGESNPYFLNIDHVKGDGAVHRRKAGSHRHAFLEIWRAPFSPDKYQLLCSNCNYAKEHYGSCPHTWAEVVPLRDSIAIRKPTRGRKVG